MILSDLTLFFFFFNLFDKTENVPFGIPPNSDRNNSAKKVLYPTLEEDSSRYCGQFPISVKCIALILILIFILVLILIFVFVLVVMFIFIFISIFIFKMIFIMMLVLIFILILICVYIFVLIFIFILILGGEKSTQVNR